MFESFRSKEHLSESLRRVIALRRELTHGDDRGSKWLAVKTFQSDLMRQMFGDLLAAPRYRPAAEFFLSDLYGARDFEQRDSEMLRVVPKLARMLPERAVHTLALAVELDELSEGLDAAMARAVRLPLTQIDYASAYRNTGSRAERVRQLVLINEIGHSLDKLARIPFIAPLLHMMRAPAEAAGLGHLQRFLQDGFDAFKSMGGANEFLETIYARQGRMIDVLFDGGTLADVLTDLG